MSLGTKVAVVTGANKGIGFATVRGLCKKFQGDVFLTARNEQLGQEAVKKLNDEGLHPKFHQLDLTDKASVDKLKNFLQSTYGGLDILVNNAGMAFKMAATEPFAQQAEMSVATNFWGTLNVCRGLFSLLRPHARIVNVSSTMSTFAALKSSDSLKARFLKPDLAMSDVEQLMNEFVRSSKAGTIKEDGWAESAYGNSKIGVTLMSFVQQKEFDKDPREDIIVNACCPGMVATDMSGNQGKGIDEGADTPLYLALLPPNTTSPKGNFIFDRTVLDWPTMPQNFGH